MSNEFIEYIQFYKSKGWHMLPVQGKIPLTAHGLLDASVDTNVLKSWWGVNGRFNGSNVAIRTGSLSDLVVLDVDAQHNGWESFKSLGLEDKLPLTPMVKTGRGGGHFYFKHKEAKNSAGRIGEGIDLRGGLNGKDGYVVAPPSIHPDTGVAYEWVVLPSEVEVAELPDFLLQIIRDASKKAPLDFGPGKRNSSLTSLAGTLHRAGVPAESMKAALLAVGNVREGLEEAEVDHMIEQSLNWELPLPPQTEIGQAELIASLYSDKIAYDKNRETWLMWGKHQWHTAKDVYPYVKDGARYLSQRIQMTADKIADEEERGKYLKANMGWIRALESSRGIDAVTKVLKSEVGKDYELDAQPFLLGVPNGVVNLINGELLIGKPDQWVTRCTEVAYNPEAPALRWEKFVTEIFRDREGNDRPELVDYVHRAIGYSTTGDVLRQCWFLHLGEGSNGKGTFLGLIKDILGTYAQKLSIKTITVRAAKRGIDNDVADLAGPRFLLSAEAGTTVELDSERIKDLVGSDSDIRASQMYKEDIEFKMYGKIHMPNNHEPRTNDDTPGFWRRVNVIPYDQSFPIDPTLRATLEGEAEGILAWAVRGAQEYIQRGLEPPDVVKHRTQIVRESNDALLSWYRDRIITNDGGKFRAGEAYPSYIAWCVANGIGERERKGRRAVREYLVMRHGMKEDNRGSYFPGVALTNGND
jgi:P4 family phage/plasmid primase-like protien